MFVIALLAVAAICPLDAAKTSRVEDPEAYAVYNVLLSKTPRQWKSLVVLNTTRTTPTSGNQRRRSFPVPEEWKATILDFYRQIDRPQRLQPRFQVAGRRVKLIDPDDAKLFAQTVMLSAVGFDRDKRHAAASYDAFGNNDGGAVLTFEKIDGMWVEQDVEGWNYVWEY
jgi:hypothetical protein